MIRREENGVVWLIHQAAHTYISGQIAEHWIGSGKMTFTPREEMLLAAYTHDAGWAQIEMLPRINPRGQPRTFTEMDLEEHFEIWQDSIEDVFAQNRYAGLITSLHCSALYEQRLRFIDDPPEHRSLVKTFLEGRRNWEKELIAAMTDHPRYGPAVLPDRLGENLRLLQVWDYISLMLCMGPVREQLLDDVPLATNVRGTISIAASGPRGMRLDPMPFDQALTLWIDARPVAKTPFESDEDLRAVLDSVPYKPLVLEIASL
jgi:hypothetical protein